MEQNEKLFIAEFYRKNYRRLYLHACSLLRRQAEAEAAVQEAFLAVCKNPADFMSKDKPVMWMEKTIENIALHIYREERNAAKLFSSFEELAPNQEPFATDVHGFELAEFCQTVVTKEEWEFFLRIAGGSSTFYEEAERHGIRLTACYKRFERIRKKIQGAYDEFNKNKP